VIIRGDGAADYQSIAELLAVLQSNGANNFSLATQP
jgi:biopolymer transport protein ExbD